MVGIAQGITLLHAPSVVGFPNARDVPDFPAWDSSSRLVPLAIET